MFFAHNAPAHAKSLSATGPACALRSNSGEGYPGSALCLSRSARLALGREDSS